MSLLSNLVGQIQWTPPDWMTRFGVRRFAAGLAVALVLGLLGLAAWHHYQDRPRPAQVVGQVVPPGVAELRDDRVTPQPLVIHFSVTASPDGDNAPVTSVAALGKIGEVLGAGISMMPAHPGQWRWRDEATLIFEPEQDWPADQRYVLRWDPSIFAPNLALADTRARFNTAPFAATINELTFYQDPVDTALRKVVATVAFTHPVDAATVADHTRFTLASGDDTINSARQRIDFNVELGPQARTAYLHSAPIDLPAVESYMTLLLEQTLTSAAGDKPLEKAQRQNVLIPDIGSYFKVVATNTLIARDADDNPRQALTLEFTDRVASSEVSAHLEAWLLPQHPILNGERVNNKYWQSAREVTTEVLGQAKSVTLSLNPVDDDVAMVHSASLDLPENRTLYLRVAEGLTSAGEFVLATPFDAVVRTPSYPKEATIAQTGAILPLSGSHQLTLIGRGVTTLKVDIGRLLDGQVNHLASQTGGDISAPVFENWRFDEDNLTQRSTRYIDVQPTHPSQAAFASLDLSEYLEQGGYFFVSVQGWDRSRGYPVGGSDRRFVLITDLGLLVKSNADGAQDVFVHSIATGDPVAGARVALLGKNGLPVIERATNARGHASLPSTRGMERERSPTVYVVRNGRDTVFMPFGRHTRMMRYSRFDVGGDYVQRGSAAEQIRAQVFTDRGLYRPGDAVELGMIVKRDDWGPLGALPLALRVVDPMGQVVLDEKRRLPAGGFLEQRFKTDVTSATGNYNATLLLIDSGNRQRALGNVRFRVEEFQPDRMRIRAAIRGQKTRGWIKPGELWTDVTLENLFGAPAQDRRVTGTLSLLPSSVEIGQFPGFRFDDPLRRDRAAVGVVQEQTLAAVQTDKGGRASLPLDLGRYDRGIYRLRVAVEGFEQDGGRSVKAVAGVMMSPLDYLVGYRSDSDLGYLTKDSAHTVAFLAVDPDGEAMALDTLTRELVEYRYVSSLVQRSNGTFAYQSVRRETPVSRDAFALAASATDYILPTDTPGEYAVKLVGDDGRVYSKVDFTVAGARNVAGNLERDAQLTLALNGSSFAPGDEIELSITAPYTGTGLITIERERVLAHQWFTADTNSTVQRIRVPDDLEGNAYVNVAFIRDLNSPEIFVSPLSYAVMPFSINRAARTLAVELDVPERVRPGETLTMGVETSLDSKVLVYAIDEGILQVANYSTPEPLDFFLRKIALQVETFQMVDLILPQFDVYRRLAAPGGGAGRAAPGNNLNPFRRATDAPVTYWSGIVQAGPQGAQLTWQVPDYFDGELRIMAVAVNDQAVGSDTERTTVRGPFVLTPNVLTATAPGDEFDVSVGVSNQIEGSAGRAQIDMMLVASENLAVVGDAQTTLELGAGDEGRARFRVRALDAPGPATLTFRAQAGEWTAHREATLSVRPPVAFVSTLRSGSTKRDGALLQFERDLYAAHAHQSVAASTSPLVLADGLLDYLEGFPHACAEQIVSKVFPTVGLLGHDDAALDESHIREQFAATITKLRARQTPEGGFRFWPASDQPAVFPSVYISHFLTDAAAKGLPVPRDMQRAAVNFMQTLAAREVTSLAAAQTRAYAIYVLTRNDVVTTTYLTNLHDYLDAAHADQWKGELVASYLAASYAMLKQDRLAAPLIDGYIVGGGERRSDFDSRLGRDAQHVYLLAQHFPARLERLDASVLQALIEPVMQNRFNTLSSAYTVLALGAYSSAVSDDDDATGLSILANGQALVTEARFARADIDHAIRSVSLTGVASRPVYYALSQAGFDRRGADSGLVEGIELDRVFLDTAGNAVVAASIGDELTVRLRVRSTGPTLSNVALVDLLPGGFEVISDSVQRTFGGWQADYVDVREDRVVFYGHVPPTQTEMTYRVKVTSSGSFTVPGAFASAMYDQSVHARTAAARFDVAPTR